MRALQYIELDVDHCANTYGVAPCTASGGPNCFNCIATCQDIPNYIEEGETLRFAVDTNYLPPEIECNPSIPDDGIAFDPAVISLGENLGQRATLTVNFKDHRSSDTGLGGDPYLSTRSYNPYEQGTYFGKFRARHPYLVGRDLRWINGELGDALADMETRHFICEAFSGPTANGSYKLIAKDVLKLADGSKALAPVANTGFLVADITAADTSLTLSPAGVGNLEYPSGEFKVNLGGKEIVVAYRDITAGNDANTLLLLHMDGADASTTFTDASTSARTGTVNGNAQIDTAQSKWLQAGLFDGTGDFVTYPDSNDWTFSGNFTIECFARFSSLAAARALFAHGSNAGNQYRCIVATNGAITFEVIDSGPVVVTMTSAAAAIAPSTLYHLAVVRVGTVWTLYKDGVSIATTTDVSTIPNFAGTFRVGADGNSDNSMAGWIDELRVSNVARYTGAFTPPLAPFRSSADILTLLRAQEGTTATTHSAQDLVQEVLEYTSADAATIIADLLENYAGVDPAYIPLVTWETETAAYLNRVYSSIIPNPTSVNTLISELIQQAGLSMWWNDRDQTIGLLVLRGILSDATHLTEENMLAGSLEISEQPDTRLSQVHVYFGQINPLTSLTDEANYRSRSINIDAVAEANYGSPAIKKIYSRWIPALGRTVADRLGTILLGRFKDPPRHFKLNLLRNSIDEIILARGYLVEAWPLQDQFGAADTVPVQVTRLRPSADVITIEADEVLFVDEDLTTRNIIIDADFNDLNLRDAHDSLYPEPQSGDVVICTINAGVVVGSTSAATPAFDVGSWPAGVDILVILNGRIQGRGGEAGNHSSSGARPGHDGGTGLYARYAIDLEYGGSNYVGGGGGGGGATSSYGGGGGAGRLPGDGGEGTSSPDDDGFDGTLDAGGIGGNEGTSGGKGGHGGDGGVPGVAGFPSIRFGSPDHPGGDAGIAIDGVSFITVTSGVGNVHGTQVN